MEKICKLCGTPYFNTAYRSSYCSTSCKNEMIKAENELRWKILFSEIRAKKRMSKIKKIYGENL